MKKIKWISGVLAVFACALLVLFRSLLFGAHEDKTGTAAPHRSTELAARVPAPVPHVAVPGENATQAVPVSVPPPEVEAAVRNQHWLSPEQETARLRKIFDESGAAAGDALDHSGRDIASALVAQLVSLHAAARLQASDCREAGCAMTVEVGSESDYMRLHSVIEGLDPRSPMTRWPGTRIIPPVIHRDGKLLVTIMLIRPDSHAVFH